MLIDYTLNIHIHGHLQTHIYSSPSSFRKHTHTYTATHHSKAKIFTHLACTSLTKRIGDFIIPYINLIFIIVSLFRHFLSTFSHLTPMIASIFNFSSVKSFDSNCYFRFIMEIIILLEFFPLFLLSFLDKRLTICLQIIPNAQSACEKCAGKIINEKKKIMLYF